MIYFIEDIEERVAKVVWGAMNNCISANIENNCYNKISNGTNSYIWFKLRVGVINQIDQNIK